MPRVLIGESGKQKVLAESMTPAPSPSQEGALSPSHAIEELAELLDVAGELIEEAQEEETPEAAAVRLAAAGEVIEAAEEHLEPAEPVVSDQPNPVIPPAAPLPARAPLLKRLMLG